MNSEILMTDAAMAIVSFYDNNEGTCCLYIRNGDVLANPAADFGSSHPKSLRIKRYEIIHGFTNARWHAIGRDLFILYTKEQECPAHPKP